MTDPCGSQCRGYTFPSNMPGGRSWLIRRRWIRVLPFPGLTAFGARDGSRVGTKGFDS